MKNSFISNIVAGTVSALLATFVIWLFGFWSAIFAWVVLISIASWKLISYSVPIPFGILFVLVAIGCTWISLRRKFDPTPLSLPIFPIVPIYPIAAPNLSENEVRVIRMLAKADGKWVSIESISSYIQLSRLLTEQAMERLFGNKFLVQEHDYLHGTMYRLSSVGRDYAIELGYAR